MSSPSRYALIGDGTWTTSCSRTKLAQDASAELRQLRRCVKK